MGRWAVNDGAFMLGSVDGAAIGQNTAGVCAGGTISSHTHTECTHIHMQAVEGAPGGRSGLQRFWIVRLEMHHSVPHATGLTGHS